MKKLPIGLQTFSELINENYYYVDKTPLIAQMVNTGKYYFLSRPRRFGKSLLVSTLKSAFAGEQALFNDLYLARHWDWSIQYPVISISFAGGVVDSVEALKENFRVIIQGIAKKQGITLQHSSSNNLFSELINALSEQAGQRVVVLIDEYDKPILDNIDNPDLACLLREELKNIYSVIKYSDAYLKFVLLTGVSKFSKVSLFSGLNNLEDISLSPDYATLCGYTENEIKQVFTEYAESTDFELLRQWYNGYNFLGDKVYNPFDVLLYFKNREFKNYWFETGSPSFLLKLVRERQYNLLEIENIFLTEADSGSFDIGDMSLETVLFQTGYLTIKHIEEFDGDKIFYLTYPNREVKASLNNHLLRDLTHTTPSQITRHRVDVYKALKNSDLASFKQALCAIFASIPHDWYRKNQLANYEGYYASIVYSCLCAIGCTVIAEDSTNQGQIDLTVIMDNKVYIIEFKVLDKNHKPGSALAQIKAKNYQQKYHQENAQVYLVGIEFDKSERNIVHFEWTNMCT